MNKNKNSKGKQLRKPISNNFAPKRLAINFDPPMLIMQYLVVDTGKLYHHKMRLDSILRKSKITRDDVLNYVKTKHHLYFVNGKIKDSQLLKFIDKILTRKGIIAKPENLTSNQQLAQTIKKQSGGLTNPNNDDFDYLNDQQEGEQQYYEEDYEDYEDPSNFTEQKAEDKNKINNKVEQKNAFLAYHQEQQEQQGDGQAQASWDLDMDQNDDFV